jgi:CheY-like chemotaxis protein
MEKILVIDDEPNILLMVLQRLRIHHYKVITALSGEQGLKRAVQDIPDIVLLDHVMPEMDGDEVLERLKKNPVTRSIPVVMFTADVKEVKVGDYLERGAVGCVYKPFAPEDLLAKIREVLGDKE